VYIEKEKQSDAEQVMVATDSQEIADALSHINVSVCMTHENHQSGTERLSEVIEQLGFDDEQILINLQGDEPMMPPVCLNQVGQADRKSTRLNSSHVALSRMPASA